MGWFGHSKFAHWEMKKKNFVSKWRRLELGTQSSLWSSQLMPTGEIQPKIFIPWTAPCIGSTVSPCTFASRNA